ncbi:MULTISPECIES: hypothetical protein [Tenacibaculum]|uniref:hypothetical protein n=1 Tax=Tenacibaculum TaxID=104267 RepID=UPI000C7B99E7|nr:hypothetical protein [Tenacibaculum piscium]MCD8406403.1 hypothetical protein [Tenacibaculum dicentrarchi]SOU87632.1 hypothetical protein TDCHD05_60104 [Tenacibaculum dicentrarchi]
MEDFNIESEVDKNNLILIADNLQAEMYKLKFNRASDFLLMKHLDFYTKEIDKIKILAVNNPRFKWQLLEQEIDSSFKKDKSLTGANIIFDWKESIVSNRVLLNFKL